MADDLKSDVERGYWALQFASFTMTVCKQDIFLRKAHVDFTFSMNKAQWLAAANQLPVPVGWTLRASGTQVIAVHPIAIVSLSIQPLFEDDTKPPLMAIVGNYFKAGTLPPMTDTLIREIEATAQQEIGAAYSVKLNYQIQHSLEVLEFLIREN